MCLLTRGGTAVLAEWAGLHITTRSLFQAEYWPSLTMPCTIVIILNKGTSLVVCRGLVVPSSARWPSLHGEKLAILSAAENHPYLKTAWRKMLLCQLKSFHWFACDGSRIKFTAQDCCFLSQNNQLVALMPQVTWAYWQHTSFARPQQQPLHLIVRAYLRCQLKTRLARNRFQGDCVTRYFYNHQHQLIFCFGRTGVWIITWQVLLRKSETCIELSSPCMDEGSCPIAWAALRRLYVTNLPKQENGWIGTFRFWEVQEK